MNKKFYVTTPIYYANGSAHIGHFLTTTAADVTARYYRQVLGEDNVFFTTGLDEHGTTVEQAAKKEGYTLDTFQQYVDKKAKDWKKAFDSTNISYDFFARTTNPKHERFAQDFIGKMVKNGDVYKGTYKGKYCNGCEKFLTLSDLNEEGHCPLHRPDQTVVVEEENYFFKLSKYAPKVKKLIETNEIKIVPENRRAEILSRLKGRIEDISISRPKEKVAWGIEFPGDTKHTVYVWVEALVNYLSSLEINDRTDFWNYAHHFLGKDISWFHNVIWPVMLLSANYSVFKGTFIHSFLLVGGAKISKSLGNVITPQDLVNKFGVDGARYLILRYFPFENDTDITIDNLAVKYNSDLANGLGNLVARVAKLCEGITIQANPSTDKILHEITTTSGKIPTLYSQAIENYNFAEALRILWGDIEVTEKYLDDESVKRNIRKIDRFINEQQPWTLKGEKKAEVVQVAVDAVRYLSTKLEPFLPETAEKIRNQFKGPKIESGTPLFPRLK